MTLVEVEREKKTKLEQFPNLGAIGSKEPVAGTVAPTAAPVNVADDHSLRSKSSLHIS